MTERKEGGWARPEAEIGWLEVRGRKPRWRKVTGGRRQSGRGCCDAADRAERGGWPHYLYSKIIALMKTPKDISKRMYEFNTNKGLINTFFY